MQTVYVRFELDTDFVGTSNVICNVVYCPQNNAVYLTDDSNWVVDFLIEDLEIDTVSVMTWYGKGE